MRKHAGVLVVACSRTSLLAQSPVAKHYLALLGVISGAAWGARVFPLPQTEHTQFKLVSFLIAGGQSTGTVLSIWVI